MDQEEVTDMEVLGEEEEEEVIHLSPVEEEVLAG